MLIVDTLPAGFGDCLWIEYGEPRFGSIVLIDGGLSATANVIRERVRHALRERNIARLRIRLFVITHIDKDHINGALAFLENPQVPVDFDEIWFNGRPQLEVGKFGHTDLLGVREGERLWQMLAVDHRKTWNRWQGGGPIVVSATGPLPVYPLDELATLTLLGPHRERLRALTEEWETVVGEIVQSETKANDEFAEDWGSVIGEIEVPETGAGDEIADAHPDFLGKMETWPPSLLNYDDPDNATANGSSIAFLLEVGGRKLFMTGDAFSEDLESSMRRLPGYDSSRRICADLFKLPHHGSERNFSPNLAKMLDCERYLFSTNCRQHRHPNYSAILRILAAGGRRPRLQFNYEADKTTCWRNRKRDVPSQFPDYDTEYPAVGTPFGHRNSWE